MAIQKINLGKDPLGEGGDTYRSANTKINENFSNTTHAASKLVGTGSDQVPLNSTLDDKCTTQVKKTITTPDSPTYGEAVYVSKADIGITNDNSLEVGYVVMTFGTSSSASLSYRAFQIAFGVRSYNVYIRNRYANATTWYDWRPISRNENNYRLTTSDAANVVVNSEGMLLRSTSSEKYKKILGNLELTDESYEQALQVKPIIYHSLAEADPDNYHYFSFSAEELGSYDPAFTFWKTHETDPETGESVELEQKEAEGINLNAICAMLHATNLKQAELIKALEDRVTSLEINTVPELEPEEDEEESK